MEEPPRSDLMSNEHDEALAKAFDARASQFERAPVQSDPAALERLVQFAGFPSGSRILDAGCGPGLVCEALLAAGYQVVGVDLSREMIERARRRCEPWGDRAEFHHLSLFDTVLDDLAPCDGALSRYVVHHVTDPLAFVARQVQLLRPGGTLVISDHLTDPDRARAQRHEAIERARDHTHTTNLTGGELVDLLCRAGLERIEYREESFWLDFDEWFDRGTPVESKDNVRAMVLTGPSIRGFRPSVQPDGSIRIDCLRGLVRGGKPTEHAPRAIPGRLVNPDSPSTFSGN
jgi:2-polyprenyl-3-methyl-5-hydroxy-6-metoxy-1,4-benzoquinol methylase